MNHIKRIAVARLETGMYITDLSEGIADGNMQEQGFIRREETLEKIRAKGLSHVFIDVRKGADSPYAVPLLVESSGFKARVSLGEEHDRAARVYGEARGLVSDILNNVKMGRAIDVTPINDLAEDINNSVLNNPNALSCLSQIREKDRYLLEHSINVGILMSIFATYLGFDRALVKELTTGGLLHDIGKIRVPSSVLNKAGSLTEAEWVEMKRHVVYGQAVLANSPGISDVAKSICALHHERLDGTGYPMGYRDEQIDLYGRMAAVVDVYDAVTATRCYHQGKSPFNAMKLLVSLADSHLDKNLVYSFIRCMSVYPVGTVVELTNGWVGVVIEPNAAMPNKPMLRVFYNIKHRRYEKPGLLDLVRSELEIARTWHADELGVKVEDFL